MTATFACDANATAAKGKFVHIISKKGQHLPMLIDQLQYIIYNEDNPRSSLGHIQHATAVMVSDSDVLLVADCHPYLTRFNNVLI